MNLLRRSLLATLGLAFFIPVATAQEVKQETTATATSETQTREEKLVEFLDNCKLIGHFTIDRRGGNGSEEAYTISKCEKLPAKDMYRLTAKIKYGTTEAEVPLEIKIVWAENTPVMILDNFWVPGMGTFSSRVMFHGKRYAGTWQHGDVNDEKQIGGLMFGRVEQIEDSPQEETAE